MTRPTLEEMIKDYDRHMSWYAPTMNRLQREWNEIRSSASTANEDKQ